MRLNIGKGHFEGMEYFVQANPDSIMTSIDMLGWTLFLGLSSLFIFPVFDGPGPNKVLRYAFLVNGLSCMLAGAGYIFQINILTFLFINLGMGGAMMTITITAVRFFKRLKVQSMPVS